MIWGHVHRTAPEYEISGRPTMCCSGPKQLGQIGAKRYHEVPGRPSFIQAEPLEEFLDQRCLQQFRIQLRIQAR
jgi:hypothetical protein